MFLYRALSDRIRDRNPTTTHRTPFYLSLIDFLSQASTLHDDTGVGGNTLGSVSDCHNAVVER